MKCGRRQCWAIAIGWAALAAPAGAQPARLPGESLRTAQRFADAEDLVQQQKWAEAVEAYLRLIDEAGDDLVPADGDPRLILPARRLVHRRIAARPELLGPYRERVERRARQLLERGQATRDPRPLDDLLDQFFCSRSAEAALHLLGDLWCERGEFELARSYWQLLLGPAATHGLGYPDAQGDAAFVRAKLILSRLLAGERDEAAKLLGAFQKEHSKAEGYLAGRAGVLAATLQSLLDAPNVAIVSALAGPAGPTTFAGDAARSGVLADLLPAAVPRPRYGAILLPEAPAAPRPGRATQVPLVRPRALAFHPVIAWGHVLVADARRVTAYSLATGAPAAQFDLATTGYTLPQTRSGRQRPEGGGRWDTSLPVRHDPRFTLTVDGTRVYARVGQTEVAPEADGAANYLVCLEWHSSPSQKRLQRRWLLKARKDATAPPAYFEGTPLADGGRLWVAVTRFDGNRATTAVSCYDGDDPDAGPLWQTDVCEAGPEAGTRHRHHLLTRAGPNLVYVTHAGAAVALDASTGRRAWAVRYPRRPPSAGRDVGSRDLAPAVAAGGRVFIAPADADRVLALDARTGTPLWESHTLDVAHLLGVLRGRLVCVRGGFHAGLVALNAATGQPEWEVAETGAGARAPFGRGFLTEDRVVWPTRGSGILQLSWDGRVQNVGAVAFLELPGGNLAYGEGHLVVATDDRLIVLAPDPPRADVEGARGHGDWLWEAERRRQAGRPAAEVRAALRFAAGADFTPAQRFDALARLAEFEAAAGRPTAAAATCRSVLESDEVRRVTVTDGAGSVHAARAWAVDRLDRLRDGGADLAALEKAAATEPDLTRRAERYPNAIATRSALRAAADQATLAGRYAEAELRWRQFLGCLGPTGVAEPSAHAVLQWLAAGRGVSPAGLTSRSPGVLQQTWSMRLSGRDDWALLPERIAAFPSVVHTAGPSHVAARAVPSGERLWERTVSFTPNWTAPLGATVIVGGASGVARLAAADGRPLWQFAVPEPAPWFGAAPGWNVMTGASPHPAMLGQFRLAGHRLFARLGGSTLLALDAETGGLLWQRSGPAAGLRPPHEPTLHPHFHADESVVVVQTVDGRFWVLDAADGRTRHIGPAPLDPWPNAPVALDGCRVIVADGRKATALEREPDGSGWTTIWTYELPQWPSLTGEPAPLRRDGAALLVGLPRNDGFEVVRLDVETGRPLDPAPLFVGRERIDLRATAVLGGRLFLAGRGRCWSVDCGSGQAGPSYSIGPSAAWRLERAGDGLVLWSETPPDPAAVAPRRGQVWRISGPNGGSIEPVVPDDEWGPRGTVRTGPGFLLVATANEVRGYGPAKREGR